MGYTVRNGTVEDVRGNRLIISRQVYIVKAEGFKGVYGSPIYSYMKIRNTRIRQKNAVFCWTSADKRAILLFTRKVYLTCRAVIKGVKPDCNRPVKNVHPCTFLTASFLQSKKLVSVWNHRHPCRIAHTVRNVEQYSQTASGLLIVY